MKILHRVYGMLWNCNDQFNIPFPVKGNKLNDLYR